MNRQRILRYILALSVLGIMVFAAQLTGEREVIFPEITAIAVGAIVAPKQSWNASPLRIYLTVSVMAFVGVGIVNAALFPKSLNLVIAIFTALICLVISKCGFVPMVSACVLPVVLDTRSIIYPLSVMVMTGIILCIQQWLIASGKYEKRKFVPVKTDNDVIRLRLFQFVSAGILLFTAGIFNEMFFVVPPLIVGYLEMTSPNSPLMKKRFTAVGLMLCAAISGTVMRLILTELLGVPLTISAILSALIVFCVMEKTQLFFPPAAAICTLPMLLSADGLWLYPLKTFVGFCVMTIIAYAKYTYNNKIKQRQNK